MDISFACSQCGQNLVIDASGAGLSVPCPHCQATLTVPAAQAEAEDAISVAPPSTATKDDPERHTNIRLKHPPQPQSNPFPETPRIFSEATPSLPSSVAEPGDDEEQLQCLNPECGARWYRSHLKQQEFEGHLVFLCPSCHMVLTPVSDMETFNFWGAVPGAFRFPFHGNGPWILVSGTLFFTFMDVGRNIVCLVWPLVTLLMYGMLGMFLFDVVRTAAQEREPELGWPDFGNIGDVVLEGLRFIGASLVVFGPSILCVFMAGLNFWGPPTSLGNIDVKAGVWVVVAVSFFLGGILYYPMAMLAVAMLDTIMGVNPVLVFRGIARAPLQYACVCALLAMLLAARMAIGFGMNFIPSWEARLLVFLPIRFVGFYGLIVSAQLLGLLYRARGERFGWL